MLKTRISLHFLLLTLLAGVLGACGGKQAPSAAASTAPAEAEAEAEDLGTASIRLVHAARAGEASFFLGDDELGAALAAGAWSSQRLSIEAGAQTLSAQVGGEALASAELEFDADGNYTVILLGITGSGTRAHRPAIIAFADDFSAPEADKANIRLINAIPGQDGVALATDGGTTFVTGVDFGAASAFRTADAASTRVEARVGGEAIASGSAPLAAGRLFTVIAWPGAEDGEAALLSISDRAN